MQRQKKNPRKKLNAELAKIQAALNGERGAYDRFVDSIQGQAPRDKAEAWINYIAQHIDTFGEQEALVYLRSRGYDCADGINELQQSWRRAADQRIAECTRGHEIFCIGNGRTRTKRRPGIPLAKARQVKNVSPVILRDFWGGLDSEEFYIDATMLRTAEWCEIGGFEDWW